MAEKYLKTSEISKKESEILVNDIERYLTSPPRNGLYVRAATKSRGFFFVLHYNEATIIPYNRCSRRKMYAGVHIVSENTNIVTEISEEILKQFPQLKENPKNEL